MQKTASNHIAQLLALLFDGQMLGKHNCASAEQIKTTPYFISSIRNPWDWYLSLWTFGVASRGGLWYRLTQKNGLDLLKTVYKDPKNSLEHCVNFSKKDHKKWQAVYQKSDDVIAFRQWLAYIHNPDNADDLGEGYGSSGIRCQVGFMTYRYLYLCCCFHSQPERGNLNNLSALKNFDTQHCYIDYFIRQESLATTFLAAIEPIRLLSNAEIFLIKNAQKTNVSFRKHRLANYYNQQAIDLVFQRDRLLIEKFNYSPP